MPFKSEKQRRYLWAKHPDIARRWAHEYPNQKDLPMYKDKEKKSALRALSVGLGKFSPSPLTQNLVEKGLKKADSYLASVALPKADKPTSAGEEVSELDKKPDEKVLSSEDKSHNTPIISPNAEMKKLSVVLSQAVRKAMSSGGQYTPYNVGISTRPQPPAPVTPPPVGAQQPAQQPQQQQGQNPAAYQGALGGPGAISPSTNPINNYGPISRSGDINGNAAFGVKNSPDSNKSASDFTKKLIQGATVAVPAAVAGAAYGHYLNKKKKKTTDTPETPKAEPEKKEAADKACTCGCGDTTRTCKCGLGCSCRKPGGSCYQKEKAAGSPAWQRTEGQNSEGGLNAKGRASYNKATGGNLKAPVTESNPSGDRAKRQNSFCARMCGMKSKETGAKTKADPDSRINKSLSKWNCKCGSALEFGQMLSGKSAASICSILDNKDTRSEGKQVENVKPKFDETESTADLNPNDATNKEQKQATVDSYAGLSSGGQRWQLGEAGINPRIGYKYLGGVVPMPDVSLRFGLPGVGGGIGLDPLPYVFGDSGQPSGRHANLPRSFWKKLQDGFRSPEDAFFLELSRIKDNAPIPEYENFLRGRGVGSSSEEIQMLAKILSESTDVKRNAMAKRLPMAAQGVLKHYNPKDPKSLFMGKQSSVALDIYAKAAARGDMARQVEREYNDGVQSGDVRPTAGTGWMEHKKKDFEAGGKHQRASKLIHGYGWTAQHSRVSNYAEGIKKRRDAVRESGRQKATNATFKGKDDYESVPTRAGMSEPRKKASVALDIYAKAVTQG